VRGFRDALVLLGAALVMGVLFFDENLSVSGDNAEFICAGAFLLALQWTFYTSSLGGGIYLQNFAAFSIFSHPVAV